MRRTIGTAMILLGIALAILAAIQLIGQESKMPAAEKLVFVERGGDQLAGTYYPGNLEAGVILAEGFGSDQIALRSLVEAFSRSGFHVFTFDFSGHGRSSGGLGFDNAETDRLAWQILDAREVFQSRSGLNDRQLLIVGHSLGARVALQSAVLDPTPPGGLILLGTQVNLVPSVQAEVFTGVRDTDLDWINSLGPENPDTNILLISGEWDDILPPRAAALLYEKLSGKQFPTSSRQASSGEKSWRRVILVEGVLHNYEVYSRKVIKSALEGAGTILGVEAEPGTAGLAQTRYLSWGAAVLGLFLLAGGLSLRLPGEISASVQTGLSLEKPGSLLLTKALLWLPALIPGALLGGLIFLTPLGTPAFNLVYISFLGGYGILMLVLYRLGWVRGVRGNLAFDLSLRWHSGTTLAVGLFALILLATAMLARTGWFYVLPVNHRLVWALIFTPITALGFWIGWQENLIILRDANKPGWGLFLNTLIGLLPFFLYAGFLAAIGSLSGVVGQLQGLLILFFSILGGILFQKVGRNSLLTSLFQSFLIYWLIMAQGVLFS